MVTSASQTWQSLYLLGNPRSWGGAGAGSGVLHPNLEGKNLEEQKH